MILLNEQFIKKNEVTINFEDRGYQFGDGIYEVIRVYNGTYFELDSHLHRLKQSAEKIEMALPYSLEEMKEKLKQLVKKNSLKNGHIYVQITRGIAPRTHHFPNESAAVLVAYTQQAARPKEKTINGISTILTEDIRWLRCDIKSLNLLGNVLAKQKAKKHGCEEAILHRDQTVSEGSSTNVFIIKNRVIYTHPANNLILHGITRKEVLELAQESDIKVVEEPFTINELLHADEVFVTSTTMEIAPVIKVDHTMIGDGRPGQLTQIIQKAFEKRIAVDCHNVWI